MILSRRSLLVSLTLHCSLVLGGYFIYLHFRDYPTLARLAGQNSRTVIVRPVKVELESSRPQVAPALPKQPSVSSPTSQAEPEQVSGPPEQLSPTIVAPERTAPQAVTPAVSVGRTYPQAGQVTASTPAKAPRATALPRATPTPPTPDAPLGWGPIAPRETPSGGESGTRSTVTRRAMPVSQPEFNLSSRFPNLGSVRVKARFEIKEDGSYEPTLLTGSGDATADVVILGKLLEFKWLPAMKNGVPEADTRILDISLEG